MNSDDDILMELRDEIPGAFQPCARYDPEGDCIEFFTSDEPFVAERLDRWVTIYRGEDSGEIIGSQIKQIRRLISDNPGLDIEIEENGEVCLAHYLRARAWQQGDEVVLKQYKVLIDRSKGIKIARPVAA